MSKKKELAVDQPSQDKATKVLHEIMAGDPVRIALSVLLGFIIGAIFMVVFDKSVVKAWANFGADPSMALSTVWWTIQDGYGALFTGSVINFGADSFVMAIRPFTETLRFAAPLIMAGLGVALTFRVGLFNIRGNTSRHANHHPHAGSGFRCCCLCNGLGNDCWCSKGKNRCSRSHRDHHVELRCFISVHIPS
jgi:hypothetical protein